MKTLKSIVSNPYLNLFVGLTLFYSGVSESWDEFQKMENIRFGVHHGVILFSLMQILKTLPELFEGLEHINQVGELGQEESATDSVS